MIKKQNPYDSFLYTLTERLFSCFFFFFLRIMENVFVLALSFLSLEKVD